MSNNKNLTNTKPYQYTYSQPMSVTMPESLYAVVYSETAFSQLSQHPAHFHTIQDAQAFVDAYCRPYAQDAYIKEAVSAQFEVSMDLLAAGNFVDARRVVEGILRARPGARARDLNESFTNKALACGVSALATIAHGLEMFNDEADLPANRSGALHHLQEGMDDIREALDGRHGLG